MHREIRDRLEEVLARPAEETSAHLAECTECRDEIAAMREQAAVLREWRAPADAEPRPGFYARVMERIEAQGARSIWTLFIESVFGRRLAYASVALALLLSISLVTLERTEVPLMASEASGLLPGEMLPSAMVIGEDQPGPVLTQGGSDQDSVLVNLVTYREQ
jgi:predicted anti-sigma-YlaC factor YlaD